MDTNWLILGIINRINCGQLQTRDSGSLFFRCDLVIVANGKTEKIASGLLNPFLAHLKTAQDQIAKGGYSIKLEPDPKIDALWFTKGTVERSVDPFSVLHYTQIAYLRFIVL